MERRLNGILLAGALALLGAAGLPARGAPDTVQPLRLADIMRLPQDTRAGCDNVTYAPGSEGTAAIRTTPNPDGPVKVDAFLFVLAITDLDAMTGTFRFEGYGGFIWCDPRLAFDAEAEGVDRRVYSQEQVYAALAANWWPGVFLPTQLGTPQRSNELLTVSADGTVKFSAKFNTRMLAQYDFTDFPLDRQTLSIPIQAGLGHPDAIDLQPIESRIGFDRQFELPEWWLLDHRAEIDPDQALFALTIDIGRKSGFYFWRILLPIIIIVSISFSVFWMTRDVLAQRQRQSATGVLTLVAFQFVATGTLPRVPYLTLIDAVVLWSFITAASTMVMNVINKRRFREDEALGLLFDRRCRWMYPAVYTIGLLAIATRQFLF